MHWVKPLRASFELLRDAEQLALGCGDNQFASVSHGVTVLSDCSSSCQYHILFLGLNGFSQGLNLVQQMIDFTRYETFLNGELPRPQEPSTDLCCRDSRDCDRRNLPRPRARNRQHVRVAVASLQSSLNQPCLNCRYGATPSATSFDLPELTSEQEVVRAKKSARRRMGGSTPRGLSQAQAQAQA